MSEALLINPKKEGTDAIEASGPLAECLRKAAKLDASGKGPFEVWHRKKGVVQEFDGRSADRAKRLAKSAEAHARPQEEKQAEAVAAAKKRETKNAEYEAKLAQEKLEMVKRTTCSSVNMYKKEPRICQITSIPICKILQIRWLAQINHLFRKNNH